MGKIAFAVARTCLGAWLAAQAAVLAVHDGAAAEWARLGLPDWLRLALAGGEIGAAVLWVLPRTTRIGGAALLLVLLGAAALHVQVDRSPLPLIGYAALVCASLVRGRRIGHAH